MSDNFLISVPYIYPVCPLSIDHAKIMLVADINARMSRAEGKNVCFPIAAHYSGVTAENVIKKLKSSDFEIKDKEYKKFLNTYKTPRTVVESFNEPNTILDYYTAQTIKDLKDLKISCDYEHFYKTNTQDYENFINTIFDIYEKKGLLIMNSAKELALNYDEEKWKKETKEELDKLEFIHPNQKVNFISSLDNIKSDWGILRNYGMGVKYKDGYVIDPMFDSELFVIYDLYKKFESLNAYKDSKQVFKEFFELLKDSKKQKLTNSILNKMLEWLPTDMFVCEEHLKNWVVKKTYAETLLFPERYRTRLYFITGMGYVNGERMSASKGTALLLKDLIDAYGNTLARMIIMFTGGHPSKMYNYTEENISTVKKMLDEFNDFIVFINSKLLDTKTEEKGYIDEFDVFYKNLKDGFYQQLLVDLMINIKKKYYKKDITDLTKVKNTLKYFMEILLPDIKI